MHTSSPKEMSMLNDDIIQEPNPFIEITITNPLINDLAISKEVNKHVIQSLRDGANAYVKSNNTKRHTKSHAQGEAYLGFYGKVSSYHVNHTRGVSN